MSMFTAVSPQIGQLPRVVLCESFDQRVLRAAHRLNQHRLARVQLLGNMDELDRVAVGYRTELSGIDVLDYEIARTQQGIRSTLAELHLDDLDPTDPVVAGAWLVRNGLADIVVAGATSSPAHVMRIYLKLLGVAEDCHTMSGMSLVTFDSCDFVRSRVVGMADVSVVPEPTTKQLADIALQSAVNFQRITGGEARVAFLSFSTMGSSDHVSVRRIHDAIQLTRTRRPDLQVDGEMQIDAALVPSVAGAKSPSSQVAGNANVLVFPSLSAGNIAMKIFQKFTGYRVLGPILQGLRHPATYIPRGSSAEDIIDQVRLLSG